MPRNLDKAIDAFGAIKKGARVIEDGTDFLLNRPNPYLYDSESEELAGSAADAAENIRADVLRNRGPETGIPLMETGVGDDAHDAFFRKGAGHNTGHAEKARHLREWEYRLRRDSEDILRMKTQADRKLQQSRDWDLQRYLKVGSVCALGALVAVVAGVAAYYAWSNFKRGVANSVISKQTSSYGA